MGVGSGDINCVTRPGQTMSENGEFGRFGCDRNAVALGIWVIGAQEGIIQLDLLCKVNE